MDKFVEASGKTIEEAIKAALNKLGVERDDVSVEVLEKPKPGFLGLGGSPAKVRITYSEDRLTRTERFLEELLERMGLNASLVSKMPDGESMSFDIQGEDMGVLIGRRGDTLEAVQHIVAYVANKGEDSGVRVTVDTEGYRAKREEALVSLASKMAAKAVKYKRNMALEPMNSYSRHVIHAALQDNPGVTTFSTGSEPNRRVIIAVPGGDRFSGSDRRPRPAGQGSRPPQRFDRKK